MNTKRIIGWCSRATVLVFFLFANGGCIWLEETKQKLDLGVDPTASALANSAAYRDTIGAYTYYQGLTPMRVRGYGLVVGLGKNGSRDCPRNVYERLIRSLYKQRGFSSTELGVKSITPEQLINDVDTAVVIVQGEIPPASVKGTRFDVAVQVLPGTQTKSLRGGRLHHMELLVFRPVSPTVSLTGQVLARASGPVFLNPFSGEEAATRSTRLEGVVGGGGKVSQDRRIRLVLLEPSYQRARQIQDRINAYFPSRERVGDAISPSFVRLRVPLEFADDTAHFLALVRGLFLSHDPQFEATRSRMLEEELVHPKAAHARIAQAFEALGRAALPALDRLYSHRKDAVSFHAAVAGLRLGDHIAGDAIGIHAQNTAGEYRFQAIHALAEAKGLASAAITLRKLLNDDDPRIQIAAYEALVERGDSTIKSVRIAWDNFILDRVPTQVASPSARASPSAGVSPSAGASAPRGGRGHGNFVYVKRSGSRRIALFGSNIRCTPPVFYRAPDGSLMINATPGDETLTTLRMAVPTGAMSPPIPAPLDVPGLIKLLGSQAELGLDDEVLGLGLDYSAVVRAIYHLCKDRSINANFILEQPNVAELFGPPRPTGRPESEL